MRAFSQALMIILALTSGVAVGAPPKRKPPPPPVEQPPPPPEPPKQDDPGLTLSPKDRATALAKEGAEFARTGQYAEASSKFQQSVLVFPMTDVYFNFGYVSEQIGEWKACVDNYTIYLDRFKQEHDGADPPEAASVRRSVEKCRETAQPPINITSSPDGAQVAIADRDKVVGTTPFETKLDPGTYTVYLLKDGFMPVETKVVVQPKQPGKFHFELRPVVNSGKVRIDVNVKDAMIFIDGKNYGITPYLETPELEVGKHQIVVKRDDYGSVNRTFDVAKGDTVDLTIDMFLTDPPPSWRDYLGYTAISLGTAGVGTGVIGFFLAKDLFNDTEDFKNYELMQNIGYYLGGSLMAVGLGLVIWEAVIERVNEDDLVETAFQPPSYIPIGGIVPIEGGFLMNGGVRF